MVITEFRQISDGRFFLTLSDGETLKVSLNETADFSLYTGRELTEGELEALRAAAALNRCRERALRIISARPMSERELFDRLVEKGETEQNAACTVAWLLELHFLNDADYAAMLVRRCAAKGYGARRARDELYRRKVPKELWDGALEALPEADETLDRLLRARLRGASPDDRDAMRRASGALLRRGYSWDEIKAAAERLREE